MREDEVVSKAILKLFSFKKFLIKQQANLFREKVSLFLDCEKASRDSNFKKEAEYQAKIDLMTNKIANTDFVIKLVDDLDENIKSHQYTHALISLNRLLILLQGTSSQPNDLYELLKMM
jgi:hypothetical protein